MPTLLIDRIPLAFTDRQLRDLFAPYGEVSRATVVTDQVGNSLGFGYVEMPDLVKAEVACKQVDGTEVSGARLHVVLLDDAT